MTATPEVKFKTKMKDEVSRFNQNSAKNEIFGNPGAKIIYRIVKYD